MVEKEEKKPEVKEKKKAPEEKKVADTSERAPRAFSKAEGDPKKARELARAKERKEQEQSALDQWEPKTDLGKKVKTGDIKDIAAILNSHAKIMEREIVDLLIPELETDFIFIGQAKGKFGGGRRRIFKQTQKKTKEGNKPNFAAMAVVGNGDGYVGLGVGKSKETMPSREKSVRLAKINIIQIGRGCGSWACGCKEPHSIPFKVKARKGSVRLELLPAPKGVGLCVDDELKKMLKLAGIKDVWSRSFGQTKQKINLVTACFDALKQLSTMRINEKQAKEIKFGQ